MIKKIKREEGSALVLVMMVLLVLSVLGATVGTLTVGSYRLSDNNKDYNSAYYIAEAGANMAYAEIESYVLSAYENSDNQAAFFGKMASPLGEGNNRDSIEYDDFESQAGDTPTAAVKIEGPAGNGDTREYVIEATGEVGGRTRTVEKPVTVNWVEKNTGDGEFPFVPSGASLVIRDYINFNGGSISGNIHIGSTEANSFRLGEYGTFSGSGIYTNYDGTPENIYTAPDWRKEKSEYFDILNKTNPETYDIPWNDYIKTVESIQYPNPGDYEYVDNNVLKDGNIVIKNEKDDNYLISFDKDYKANKLVINSDRTLKINTNNKNVTLIVDELNITQGHIEIVDEGTLNLVVLNKFNFGGSSTINKNGTANNFNLYYAGHTELTLDGNQYINGGAHIKHANLKLTGSGNLKGPILSNGQIVKVNGGSLNQMLLVAPKANVIVDGGGEVKGTIIANELKLDGGGEVKFQESNYDNFFKGSNSGDEKVSSVESLLTPGIVIEN